MIIMQGARGFLPTNRLLVVIGSLLLCYALASCSQEKSLPQIYPSLDTPVMATIDGRALLITNNSDKTIYHRIFPTEILPLIEWAPCLAPETCPAEQRIDPGQEKRISFRSFVGKETESLTIFWWTYLDKKPGASIPPMELNEFVLPLP